MPLSPLDIGYSPCPNDTFTMAALAGGRIDSTLVFRPVLADVETLNRWALNGRLPVTKLSFFALGKVLSRYALLFSGAALGRGCGPLVVARPGKNRSQLSEGIIAAPGELTTARLLLSLFLDGIPRFKQMIFSEIMPAVKRGEADFGLVIHEGRFTYSGYNLVEVLDLGQWWEEETGEPVPLGGMAIRRDLDEGTARLVNQAILSSLNHAQWGNEAVTKYVLSHAQELSPDVIKRHIDLYVNEFTTDIGSSGRRAIEILFQKAANKGLIPTPTHPLMAYN
jgi:1,4-dihydroxy-6-naphthoate synthase